MKTLQKKWLLLLFLFPLWASAQKAAPEQTANQEIEQVLKNLYPKGDFSGNVLVARKGKVVYQKSFGFADREANLPNLPDTRFRIASLTKAFTAVRVLQLVEQGKIRLDGTISDYVPDYQPPAGKAVTIHHLLSHTSGIPDFIGPAAAPPGKELPLRGFVKELQQVKPAFEPGSQFAYANSTYILLAYIIEQVTGNSFRDNLNEHIFRKAGMKNSGCEMPGERVQKQANGYVPGESGVVEAPPFNVSVFKGAGAVYSTVEDLQRWDQALSGNVLLSAEMKEKMFTPVHEPYGYGWFVRQVPGVGKMVYHEGGIPGFASLIARGLDKGYLIVVLSNMETEESPGGKLVQQVVQILEKHPEKK